MVTIALISVALLALLVFVLFGALLEMYRDIRQLREAIGILDQPLNVDVGPVAGTNPSNYGLPQALDSAVSALILFLSERCGTCRSLAAGLSIPLPPGLWIVLEARDTDSAVTFLNSFNLNRLTLDEHVVVDVGGKIAYRIGLDTTPIGFRVENGAIVSATTVPSSRYLNTILPEPILLKTDGIINKG